MFFRQNTQSFTFLEGEQEIQRIEEDRIIVKGNQSWWAVSAEWCWCLRTMFESMVAKLVRCC